MNKFNQIKSKLSAYLAYIQLMMSLVPKDIAGIKINESKEYLIEIHEFLEKANKNEMLTKGPVLVSSLDRIVDYYKKICPPKVSIEEIALSFSKLCRKNKEIYSWGLDYGWIQSVMDCSKIRFYEDLPFHSKVGIGHHAGYASVEEVYLLMDAFFMLVLAENAYEQMHEYANKAKHYSKQDITKAVYKLLSFFNQNVATYSRLSILGFFSFIEAFVNSVGYDASLRIGDRISFEEMEMLHGKKKNRYISLEYKMEKYPAIIRLDKKSPIILSDPKQRREPFKTFIKTIKEIRDSSVHFSPKKEPIWRKPDNWLEQARNASKISLEVGSEFWEACYPGRGQPRYLNKLDYEKNLNIAKTRIEMKDELINE